MQWEIVVGLEIHAQLATRSKIFSGASTQYGAAPNSQASLVDLGYPGTLPVLNGDCVKMAVKFGLATNCEIARRSVFARKNYFYPDLPKGYQISQYELPVVHGGRVDVVLEDGSTRTVGIVRAHLEEDAGKSLHEDFAGMSGIDLNRAGTGLLEIVSAPDLRSAAEAGAYMRKIHALVRYLEICDGNLQEGSFRCDANVSVRRLGETRLGTRTELKNLNSFRFVEKAIEIEAARQIELIESGGAVAQETRLYDPDRNETRPMRSKEEANDYRYFPDPDLLPVSIDERLVAQVRASLPELPDAKRERFMRDYALPAYDAQVLTVERALADYFETVAKATKATPKIAANWVMGEVMGALNRSGTAIADTRVPAPVLAGLLDAIESKKISGKQGKEVFEGLWELDARPPKGTSAVDEIIEKRGLVQISDSASIDKLVAEVIAANPTQVEQFRSGKQQVLGFLVGQVMKASRGKANPQQVNDALRKQLGARSS
ncbi:MAG TPA: Asp-tRNA(Asn)/Glu-tRNA(Gln) amidotransferase subunit GatB [Gammaproteobacteria bacterium]|nr:Asp-tRNA(Asn)/Glu-tRNA(Gln) amidotransferase subunit GatB [Gammaproteobacteria bacterium]